MKTLAILFGIIALTLLAAIPYALWHRPIPGRYQIISGSYAITVYNEDGTPYKSGPGETTLYRLDTVTGQVDRWNNYVSALGEAEYWSPLTPHTNRHANASSPAAAAPAASAGTPPPAPPSRE